MVRSVIEEGLSKSAAARRFNTTPKTHCVLLMKSALLYTTTVLTGGLVWFATKFQLGVVPPEISLIYRFSVAALLLTGLAPVGPSDGPHAISHADGAEHTVVAKMHRTMRVAAADHATRYLSIAAERG
jgi:hypothetical protein